MGFSLGGSYGSTNSSSKSSDTQANTYTPGQSGLQDTLMAALSKLLPGVAAGGISPNVAAVQTENADTINKSYSSMGDKMNKFLAARGFGQSGESGKVALNTELGRQGALAGNNAAAAEQQLNFNQGLLSDSLLAAFNKIGVSDTSSGSGNASGWSFGGGVGGKVPGF